MLRTRIRTGPVSGLVLSAVFAALFTLLSTAELYVNDLAPELGRPAPVTLRVPYGLHIVHRDYDGHRALWYVHTRLMVPRNTVLQEQNEDHHAAFVYELSRRPPTSGRLASTYVIHFIVCMMLTV